MSEKSLGVCARACQKSHSAFAPRRRAASARRRHVPRRDLGRMRWGDVKKGGMTFQVPFNHVCLLPCVCSFPPFSCPPFLFSPRTSLRTGPRPGGRPSVVLGAVANPNSPPPAHVTSFGRFAPSDPHTVRDNAEAVNAYYC